MRCSNYFTAVPYLKFEGKTGTADNRSFTRVYVVFRIVKANLLSKFYICKPFPKYIFTKFKYFINRTAFTTFAGKMQE
jgi:hypothetical protein